LILDLVDDHRRDNQAADYDDVEDADHRSAPFHFF
jgi:hypothetical protein